MLEDVYYEGTMEEWKSIDIVHDRHEIEFGDLIPGSPLQEIKAERLMHVPGNDALFMANIHFRCALPDSACNSDFEINVKGKDVTECFRIV